FDLVVYPQHIIAFRWYLACSRLHAGRCRRKRIMMRISHCMRKKWKNQSSGVQVPGLHLTDCLLMHSLSAFHLHDIRREHVRHVPSNDHPNLPLTSSFGAADDSTAAFVPELLCVARVWG